MVELKINGKTVKANGGETILTVALREGFTIPSLCNHEALPPDGRCRLCLVEVRKGGRRRLVASCLFNIENTIEVFTDSDEIKKIRKNIIELLLSRCPTSDVINRLALECGADINKYSKDIDKGKCILCGICIRTCETIVGVSALCFSGKGPMKKVTTPFDEPSSVCIGCGACAFACPTGHIYIDESNGIRTIWKKRFELAKCTKCGRLHMPIEQIEFIYKKTGTPLNELMVCQNCK